jgi:twitching motility protein PilT
MIEDANRTREIHDAIAQGRHPYGMISFDQSLADLVRKKLVTYDEAVKQSSSPSDFALLFRGVSGGGSGAGEWDGESESEPDMGRAGGNGNKSSGSGQHSSDFEIDRFGK